MLTLTDKLPDTLSDLILRAIDDMIYVMRSGRYTIDLGIWHSSAMTNTKCSVCFAGAVIARGLPQHHDYTDIWADDFEKDVNLKFHALDEIRQGDLGTALSYLVGGTILLGPGIICNAPRVDSFHDIDLHDKNTRRKFYRQMRTMAAYLKSIKL